MLSVIRAGLQRVKRRRICWQRGPQAEYSHIGATKHPLHLVPSSKSATAGGSQLTGSDMDMGVDWDPKRRARRRSIDALTCHSVADKNSDKPIVVLTGPAREVNTLDPVFLKAGPLMRSRNPIKRPYGSKRSVFLSPHISSCLLLPGTFVV